ncbi:MAG TPA: ComEC/Rec2 family competence protein, partial [Terriglobales bacterium]|nr:ComEC/Rec2 family competence protein [Terriglobales bacterium]
PASGVAMAAIFAYATLTREGSPVWRAALMFAAYLAARLLYRERAALNTIGMAALILLTSHPRALFAASFQMSFLCVGLLAGIGVPVLQRTLGPFERGLRNLDALACDRSVPPAVAQFRLDLRLIIRRLSLLLPGRVSGWLLVGGLRVLFGFSELVVLSAVMQIGMALPMAYYFHRATSVALVANLLAVPLLQLLMPAAVLAICVSYVSPGLAKVPAAIANFALDNIAGSVRWLGGMRIADIRLPAPSLAMVLFAGAAIATCIFCIRRRAWIAVGGAGCLLASTVLLWTVPPPEHFRSGALEMTAIDVGQGDSILLVLPDGNKLLVDAGGLPFWMHSQMDIGEDVVSAYLWARGFSRIDAIALTHAHGDHMGGFPAVIANFHPRELWLPENVVEEEARPLLAVAARYGVRLIYRGAGETFPYGGARIRILAPDPQFPIRSGHRNDESLVMQVEHGDTSVLLEADAEKGTERLVASHHPRADVLKVAHHGSASATNTDLLEAVRPRYAVISAGTRNVYRHPRPEVLQRLQDAGALTYRTDLDGATTFYLDGKRVTVENFRPH